jgi:hypothetical protein
MAYGFGGYDIDPGSEYESPMYGPYPDFEVPEYGDPMAPFSAAGPGASQQGYTPMGALLFGDTAYNIYVSVMNWIRMTRPIE